MGKRILIIQGHPDSGSAHLCHALEESYARGAMAAAAIKKWLGRLETLGKKGD